MKREARVLTDYDFHPDEETVRVFLTPAAGVLRLDDEVAVTSDRTESVAHQCHQFSPLLRRLSSYIRP